MRRPDLTLAIFGDAAHIAIMAGKDVPSIGKMQQLVADAKAELKARGIDTSKMMPADFLRAARDARIKSDTDVRARRFPAKSEPK